MNIKNSVVIGMIGYGIAAHHHIKNFLRLKNVKIKWVCNQSSCTLQHVTIQYPFLSCTKNYMEVLQDPDVNAVVISTPPDTHFKIAMASLKAEKHILLEKPAVITREELTSLNENIKKYPQLVFLDCSARHSRLQPKFYFFKQMICSGELGSIYAIHHQVVNRNTRPGIEYHPKAKWFLNKKTAGGGPLLDWGVYDLSFHFGILGDIHVPLNLESSIVNGLDPFNFYDVEEHGMTFMKLYPNLAYYWERSSHAHNETKNETRIYGTKGGIKLSYLAWDSAKATHYFFDHNGNSKKETINVDLKGQSSADEDYYALDFHFIYCILKRSFPILPFELTVKHLNIIFNLIHPRKSIEK